MSYVITGFLLRLVPFLTSAIMVNLLWWYT